MTARDDLARVIRSALLDRSPMGDLWINSNDLNGVNDHLADAVIREWLPTVLDPLQAYPDALAQMADNLRAALRGDA